MLDLTCDTLRLCDGMLDYMPPETSSLGHLSGVYGFHLHVAVNGRDYVLLTSEVNFNAAACMYVLTEAPVAVQSTEIDMPTLTLPQQFGVYL